MNDVCRALKTLQLFKSLNSIEIEILAKHMEILEFHPQDVIIQQGQNVKGLFIILSGQAEVCLRQPGVREAKLATLSTDQFFGDVVLFRGGLASATIRSLTTTKCFFLSTEIFKAMGILNPDIWYKMTVAITRHVCTRIISTIHMVMDFLNDMQMDHYKFIKKVRTEQVSLDNVSLSFLNELMVFQNYSYVELIKLLPYMKSMSFPKNRIIATEHINNDSYFVVIQGAVGVVSSHNNHATKLNILGAGTMCVQDYHPIIFPKKNSIIPVTYITREDTIVYKIEHEQLEKLYHKERALYYKWNLSVSYFLMSMLDSINKQLIRYQNTYQHNSIKTQFKI